ASPTCWRTRPSRIYARRASTCRTKSISVEGWGRDRRVGPGRHGVERLALAGSLTRELAAPRRPCRPSPHERKDGAVAPFDSFRNADERAARRPSSKRSELGGAWPA